MTLKQKAKTKKQNQPTDSQPDEQDLSPPQVQLATEYDLPPDAFLLLLVSQRISGRLKQPDMLEKLKIYTDSIEDGKKFSINQQMKLFLGNLSSIASDLQRNI